MSHTHPMTARPRVLALLTAAITLVALVATATRPASADTLPVHYSFAYGIGQELAHPGAAPPGSNDFSCRPSAAHPRPVVLVHGTFGDMTDSWQALSPLLRNAGYCVFALNYGGTPSWNPLQATGDIPASATQLSSFVDRVLSATGADQVDLVGHSQGGMMPRYYLRFLGGAAKVHTLVGLAPSNHGTDLDHIADLLQVFPWASPIVMAACTACDQQVDGSAFLQKLNAGGDTVSGVRYTVIETKYDEVVTPYTSALLSGDQVTNVILQDQCAQDLSDHLAVIYDRNALHDVLNALDPANATPVQCAPVAPVVGG